MAQEAGITLKVTTSKAIQNVVALADSFKYVVDAAMEASGVGKVIKAISKPIKIVTKGVNKLVNWLGKKFKAGAGGAGKETKSLMDRFAALNQAVELGQKVMGAFAGAITGAMDASRELRGDMDPLIRNFDKVKTKSRATAAALGDSFIAAYTGILVAIQETSGGTQSWIKDNKKLITGKLVEWLGKTARFLISVATPALQIFVGIWGSLKLAAQAATKGVTIAIEGITSVLARGARALGKVDLAEQLEGWRDAAKETGADIDKDMVDTLEDTAAKMEKLGKAGAAAYKKTTEIIAKAHKASQAAIGKAGKTPMLSQAERLIAEGEKLLELWPRSEAAFRKMTAGMKFEDARTQIELVEAEVDKFNKMLSIGGVAAVDDVAGPLQALLDKFGLDYDLKITGDANEVIENMTRATDILSGSLVKVKEDATLANDAIVSTADKAAAAAQTAITWQQELQHEMVATGQTATESLGAALMMMAQGAEETGEAFKDLGKTIILAVYDAVTKSVLAYATQAAAGTAANLAPAGPIAAVAGAGAMLAFVRGLLSQMMTGAALGGFVGGGGGKLDRRDKVGPFMLAQGEYIMPADEVQAMRRFVGQMGATSGGSAVASSTQTSATTNEIKIDFKSDQLPNRTETKRWVKTTILPALRELQAVGY